MTRLELLRQALAHKQVIRFTYDGLERLVEPHAFGVTAGLKLMLRGYQTGGESNTGLGWKLFDLGRAEDLELIEVNFITPRNGYRTGDGAMAMILDELPEEMVA